MNKNRGLSILMLSLMLAVILAGCGGNNSGTANDAGGDPAKIDAEAIYKNRCIGCHGTELQGRTGPNLQKVGASMSEADLAAKITDGSKGMPAFKKVLKEAEITALAAWLAGKK